MKGRCPKEKKEHNKFTFFSFLKEISIIFNTQPADKDTSVSSFTATDVLRFVPFLATQYYNIVATLFRMVVTLFQHCHAVMRSKSSLRMRNERRNSSLMKPHYRDLGSASDWMKQIFSQSEAILRSGQYARTLLERAWSSALKASR